MKSRTLDSTSAIFSKLTTQNPYLSLFDCIKNNKTIPALLNQIENDESKKAKIQSLLVAIQEGNSDAEIFSDQDCHLYLLLLLKDEKIEFYQGMTVYIYLISLQQFTDKLPLKDCDSEYAIQRDFSVVKLMEKDVLTEEGAYYLKQLSENIKEYTKTDCIDELKNFVDSLPPSECWVSKIAVCLNSGFLNKFIDESTRTVSVNVGFDLMVSRVLKSTPYFIVNHSSVLNGNDNPRSSQLYFPPSSIIQFCLSKVSANPLMPTFLFGATGLTKLEQLHQQNKHPILLYSNAVKFNVTKAHDFPCGPLGNIFHDLHHLFWGGLLSLSFRARIYEFLIPNLTSIFEMAKLHDNIKSSKVVESLIENLGDFDVLSITHQAEKRRETLYLQKCLAASCFKGYAGFSSIGEREYDFLLFQMEKIRLEQKEWGLEEITTWSLFINQIKDKVDNNRRHLYSTQKEERLGLTYDSFGEALLKMAKNSIEPMELSQDNNPKPIDWSAWLEMVDASPDSNSLWLKCNDQTRLGEFLYLINNCNLTFYHPYIPMTEEYKAKFRVFLEEGLGLAQDNKVETETAFDTFRFGRLSFM